VTVVQSSKMAPREPLLPGELAPDRATGPAVDTDYDHTHENHGHHTSHADHPSSSSMRRSHSGTGLLATAVAAAERTSRSPSSSARTYDSRTAGTSSGGMRAKLGLGGIARRTLGIALLLVVVCLWTLSNFLASVSAQHQ
jgi:solute carrier family 35 protein F5